MDPGLLLYQDVNLKVNTLFSMAFKFEKLKVWQKALDLSATVHLLTRKFPKEEWYVLSSQVKRTPDSVS